VLSCRTVNEEEVTERRSNFQRGQQHVGRSSFRASVRGELYRSSMLQGSVRSRRSLRVSDEMKAANGV